MSLRIHDRLLAIAIESPWGPMSVASLSRERQGKDFNIAATGIGVLECFQMRIHQVPLTDFRKNGSIEKHDGQWPFPALQTIEIVFS